MCHKCTDDIKFCHLHTHDEFSTLDGINRVDTLPKYAKSLGMDSLAQTNHGWIV